MGLIRDILGLGRSVKEVAEVFVPNKTDAARQQHREHRAALEQFSSEFERGFGGGPFHQFVDALNRLPRPVLALGTVGLFVFAMTDPVAFSTRMSGLDTVPRELWWLLGAIVSFYFGARELHYVRAQKRAQPTQVNGFLPSFSSVRPQNPSLTPTSDNAALDDWRRTRQTGAK